MAIQKNDITCCQQWKTKGGIFMQGALTAMKSSILALTKICGDSIPMLIVRKCSLGYKDMVADMRPFEYYAQFLH